MKGKLDGKEMANKVLDIIADKFEKFDKSSPKAKDIRLVEDLGADSLDVVELIMTFEDEFGISLPDEDVSKLKTVGGIITYINNIK